MRSLGRDGHHDAVHVDLDEVALTSTTLPAIRFDWPRKFATNVVLGFS